MEGVSYIIHLILQGFISRIEDPELDAPSRKTCEPYPVRSDNDLPGTLLHPLPVLALHTHPGGTGLLSSDMCRATRYLREKQAKTPATSCTSRHIYWLHTYYALQGGTGHAGYI